jgi:ribosomal protein S27E
MANKKKNKKDGLQPKFESKVLLLHCKCDSCTNWELAYHLGAYYLVCATCEEQVFLNLTNLDPHPQFHWEPKK